MRSVLLLPTACRRRFLHLGSSIGARETLRKLTAAEEGAQYNLRWLRKVLDGLDRNLIRGRGDRDFFFYMIKLCTKLKALVAGRRIHDQLVRMGIDRQLPLAKFVVQMYLSCGSLDEARSVFDQLPSKDIGLWTAVISAYAKYGRWQESIKLVEAMEERTGWAKATYFAVMRAFNSAESIAGARLVHSRIVELGLEDDELVRAALIEMFGRCGSLEEAWKIFSSGGGGGSGDSLRCSSVLAWNSIIAACVQNGQLKVAIELFWKMEQQGTRPNGVTLATVLDACAASRDLLGGKAVAALVAAYDCQCSELVNTALVYMYGKCGSLIDARNVFDGMSHRGPAVWSKMIAAYSEHGHCSEGFDLLKKMESLLDSEASTCIAFLQACGSLLDLESGRNVHAWVTKNGLEQDVFVGNALVDMYGKCGSVDEARVVFDSMKERNWFSWNSMLASYSSSGYSLETLQIFLEMLQEGVKPNVKTLASVLVACGHAGFVREGILHLVYMTSDYDVVPTSEHYACAVGLLGRSGWLKEAEYYVSKLPDAEEPVWDALVTACRIGGDLERGRSAAESLLDRNPNAARSYVVLAGIYEGLGREDDAARVREAMASKGLAEERVTSAILVGSGGACHEFVSGETTHKRIQRIHAELQDLKTKITNEGYIAADPSNLVMHEVAEERRAESMLYHSEKLAMAFGSIKIRGGSPLRIIRNSRTCVDCHTAMKFMSKAMGRTLILRDGGIQLHRFEDGRCACKDYW